MRLLVAGGFDMVIFLTGVGTRALAKVAETEISREQFAAALGRVAVVARGPKPVAALKELGVAVTLAVPEPHTWRDLLRALDEGAASLPVQRAPRRRSGIWGRESRIVGRARRAWRGGNARSRV